MEHSNANQLVTVGARSRRAYSSPTFTLVGSLQGLTASNVTGPYCDANFMLARDTGSCPIG